MTVIEILLLAIIVLLLIIIHILIGKVHNAFVFGIAYSDVRWNSELNKLLDEIRYMNIVNSNSDVSYATRLVRRKIMGMIIDMKANIIRTDGGKKVKWKKS